MLHLDSFKITKDSSLPAFSNLSFLGERKYISFIFALCQKRCSPISILKLSIFCESKHRLHSYILYWDVVQCSLKVKSAACTVGTWGKLGSWPQGEQIVKINNLATFCWNKFVCKLLLIKIPFFCLIPCSGVTTAKYSLHIDIASWMPFLTSFCVFIEWNVVK